MRARRRRRAALVAAGLVAALVAGEAVARWGVGLGDPPLVEAHPRIEYRYRPDQDLRRFGRRFRTNALGMRSPPWSQPRPPGERRVLVLGDSIVAGGSLIDQDELATGLLGRSLARELSTPVLLGIVSAGSWGPANLLAWVEVNGWLDADAVAIVVSSRDADDVPTFAPLDPATYPTRRPLSALTEALTVYMPRLFERRAAPPPSSGVRALAALEALIGSARAGGRPVVVALHWEQLELVDGEPDGLARQRALAAAAGAEVVSLRPAFAGALQRGEEPYRDGIHPTPLGQRLIAEALHRPLAIALAGGRRAVPEVGSSAPAPRLSRSASR
jgi:lysophospholipase L1-like esterase